MKRWSQKVSQWAGYILVICILPVIAMVGSRTVTVISENMPIPRKSCIIIDPGHGGEDGGATSCTGILESSINLEIGLRLNDLFHLLGYDTRMIRTTDTSIYIQGTTIAQKKISDLKERVRIANGIENGFLLSIHQNYFADNRYKGAQVFYAATAGSEILARELQAALVNTVNPGSNRRHKEAKGVYLMEHIRIPAVLIECGFLSHPEEEALLRTPEYQKKLCCTIAVAVSQYLSNT